MLDKSFLNLCCYCRDCVAFSGLGSIASRVLFVSALVLGYGEEMMAEVRRTLLFKRELHTC